jgi:hypothetical protein
MYVQKMSRGGREEKTDPFVAGLAGGCYIFGNDSAVVQQVPTFLPLPKVQFSFCCFFTFLLSFGRFGILEGRADRR